MTKYSGAVLIIGSLLWDTEKETRANWQLNRLDLANKQTVYAPIRYGRLSEKRDYTYTMVFSQLCYRTDYGLGTAILVPFQHRIQTSRDLIEEASELWKAEADISTNRVLS